MDLGALTDRSLSDGYWEVEQLREEAWGIDWEDPDQKQPIARHELTAEQWSLIEALYELRVLTRGQIERQFVTSPTRLSLSRMLARLAAVGLLRRGWIYGTGGRRGAASIYVLERKGFALLRDASDHHAAEPWKRPVLNSAQHAVHDLERNEWLFAFRSLAPRQLRRFLGPQSSKLVVPRVWEPRGPKRPLRLEDLTPPGIINLPSKEFSNIIPDLTLELRREGPDGEEISTDFLVENEWRNSSKDVLGKALAYDGLLNGWWAEHPRYAALGRRPTVLFAVPSVARARRYLSIFDKALQGHVVQAPHTQTREENELGIVPRKKRIYLGRQYIYFVVSRDVHQRTLRAWRVPAMPPERRVQQASNAHERQRLARAIPRPAVLLDPSELVDPATSSGRNGRR